MIKKNLLIVLTILVVSGVSYIGYFYYKNLRGIGPAVKAPSADITKIQDKPNFSLNLPDGFEIGIFAKDLQGPRVIVRDSKGNLIASETGAGRITALIDTDGDGSAEKRATVADGLNRPHGIAFNCSDDPEKTKFMGVRAYPCRIYVAESHQITEYEYDDVNLKAVNGHKIADLPDGGNHFTRTLLFMPYPNQNELLVSIGSSCNVCHEADEKRAKIFSYNTSTGEFKEFARGLRNSVFMNIHPVTGKIWATEMGRDLIGDDIPPDEVNIVERGRNYGWPNCYGKSIHDTDFDRNTYIRNPCMEPFEAESHIDLQAHSAPLGLAFIPEEGWPEDMWYNLLVAYHGSWNRTTPTGYKIVQFRLDANGKLLDAAPKDFISGWLPEGVKREGALGRPVDILVEPGGTIYISDDKAGVIYLVRRTK